MQRGQELLGLVVEIGALPAECLDDGLPLGEGGSCGAVERRVVGERVPEVDDLRGKSFLHLLRITLATGFKQGVSWNKM